jgi:hypothetical protein
VFEGRSATCTGRGEDRYGRLVAKCEVNGADIGSLLVRSGLALAYRRYGMDYDLDEKTAAAKGLGLHDMTLELPSDFRARHRTAAAPRAVPARCRIKGNISASGARIYHRPGQRDYDATRIREEAGERWFCSEADARAAGWRAAKR